MNGLERLEQLRRDRKIGYFACGNGQGRQAFCTVWGYPTSVILTSEEAPTVALAIDAALAKMDATVTTRPVTDMVTRMPG